MFQKQTFLSNQFYIATASILLAVILASFGSYFSKIGFVHPEVILTTKFDTLSHKPHIIFLINKDPNNYEAHSTIPPFAEKLSKHSEYKTTVITAQGELPGIYFPDLNILPDADLLVIFFRRAALPHDQLNLIKNYLDSGNPIIAIRTANHAFSVRSVDGEIPKGYEDWWDFVPDILGSINRGYSSPELGTKVEIAQGMSSHPILDNPEPAKWHSKGNLYLSYPLIDKKASVLLTGSDGEVIEPIAWTRTTENNSRVFYTSLGYPEDFELPQFRKLMVNAIKWTLEID